MPAKTDAVYVATNGYVLALSPADGSKLWRVALPRGAGASPLVLLIKGERLFVGGKGRVWCLNRRDGSVVWENGLPKTGFSAVLLALEGASGGDGAGLVVAEIVRRQQQAAAAAASAG